MDLVEIGWTGKAHGLKGEIKLRIASHFEDDLLEAKSLLIGDPPVPYFVEYFRGGGAIIAKFENLDQREQLVLLSNQPVFLQEHQVSAEAPAEDTPFDHLVGYHIIAEHYPELGPITGIMDLPEHHLAELEHEGKDILIPLHEDLILGEDAGAKQVRMQLPQGLLEI
jgi:16S rRNA processing protein RimM